MTDEILYIAHIERLTNRTKRTISNWIKSGVFPRPYYVCGRCAWLRSDIERWQENLGAGAGVAPAGSTTVDTSHEAQG